MVHNPERILIVKLTALGDILHALPVLRHLRRLFPKARIDWALQVGADMLGNDPDINHVYNVGRGKGFFGGIRWLKDVRKLLRPNKYDLAIDLQGLAKSGLVAWASGAREIVGFGGRNCREGNWLFTNHRYTPPMDVHVARQNLALLQHFDLEAPELNIPMLHTCAEDETAIDELLQQETGQHITSGVILHPGVSRENKRWPAKRFAHLSAMLADHKPGPILLASGSQDEHAICHSIAQESTASPTPIVLPRISLGQFIALVKRAALFIGNDSGPTHIAFSCGIPSVYLFGPTLPWRNGGYDCTGGTYRHVVASEDHVRNQTRPYVRDEGLMERISADEVYAAALPFIETSGEPDDC